jgi:hypothetical protein
VRMVIAPLEQLCGERVPKCMAAGRFESPPFRPASVTARCTVDSWRRNRVGGPNRSSADPPGKDELPQPVGARISDASHRESPVTSLGRTRLGDPPDGADRLLEVLFERLSYGVRPHHSTILLSFPQSDGDLQPLEIEIRSPAARGTLTILSSPTAQASHGRISKFHVLNYMPGWRNWQTHRT